MDDVWRQELSGLAEKNRRRHLLSLTPLPYGRLRLPDGRELLNLCGNDFLDLALDPRVREAARRALDETGAGAGASRLVTGNLPLHEQAEAAVAELVDQPAALLVGSGWHANTGLLPALAAKGDLLLSDELNHASLIDGCRLTGSRVLVYRHADPADCEAILSRERVAHRRAFIVTESVFSMDGDLAPLTDLADLAARHNAGLVVDEAHAVGVWGHGRGLVAECGLSRRVTALVVTFGKALGGYGAAICGSALLREKLVNTARSLIFSTALLPPAVAAAKEAARIVREEGASLLARLWRNAALLTDPLRAAGVKLPEPCGPIIPVVLGEERRALDIAARLEQCGILARAIRPPTVPTGTCRLRLTVGAAHKAEDITAAARIICRELHR